jgi:hypothetical protein
MTTVQFNYAKKCILVKRKYEGLQHLEDLKSFIKKKLVFKYINFSINNCIYIQLFIYSLYINNLFIYTYIYTHTHTHTHN